jgi:hypothetical protein
LSFSIPHRKEDELLSYATLMASFAAEFLRKYKFGSIEKLLWEESLALRRKVGPVWRAWKCMP